MKYGKKPDRLERPPLDPEKIMMGKDLARSVTAGETAGHYMVPSSEGEHWDVWIGKDDWTCDCPDHIFRRKDTGPDAGENVACKHICAVLLHIKDPEAIQMEVDAVKRREKEYVDPDAAGLVAEILRMKREGLI